MTERTDKGIMPEKILEEFTEKRVWEKVESCEKISVGASGAELFLVSSPGKKYVLKAAGKQGERNEDVMKSFRREYEFYRLARELGLSFVPELLHAENHPEYGIVLVLKAYEQIPHAAWNSELQKAAMDLGARVNSLPVKALAPLGLLREPVRMDEEAARNSYRSWLEILSEHEGRFDRRVLDVIYRKIGEVCPILNSEPLYVCHGDFHPENVLRDGKNLLLCDWQNIHIGKSAEDFSFFLSRGQGFGIPMEEEELLEYYCERLSMYTCRRIEPETVRMERDASMLLTTFSCWAYYLRKASYESVAIHFRNMENAVKRLNL